MLGRRYSVELARLESPSLAWNTTLTSPDILQAVEDGRLEVVLDVSRPAGTSAFETAANVVTWHIDHFHADFRGSVLPRSALSSTP